MVTGYIFERIDEENKDLVFMYIPGLFTAVYNKGSNKFRYINDPQIKTSKTSDFLDKLKAHPNMRLISEVELPYPMKAEIISPIRGGSGGELERAIKENLMKYK